MRKRILFSVLIFTCISAFVFAVPTIGVDWSWSGDTITATSTDGKAHELCQC
jgi:hypothetical protein